MMEGREAVRTHTEASDRYDTVWECVIPYIEDLRDREAVSVTCKSWNEIDSITRKHVTVALCYTATPAQLSQRFPNLESLKFKGDPRAYATATPWVEEVAKSLRKVKAVHFRCMSVNDSDLELLARTRGQILEVLNLDKCSGFSTDGLLHITRSCRNLKTLLMEESRIAENDGEWLHELALNNTVLENLSCFMTGLTQVDFQDLELILSNCASLVTLKIDDCDILQLLFIWHVVIPDLTMAFRRR